MKTMKSKMQAAKAFSPQTGGASLLWPAVLAGFFLLGACLCLLAKGPLPSLAACPMIQASWTLAGQYVLGACLVFLPRLFDRYTALHLPPLCCFVFDAFLLAALALGVGLGCYDRLPGWDKVLHGCSAALSCLLGFGLLGSSLAPGERKSPAVALRDALAAFCFSQFVGVAWEFVEYAIDEVSQHNAQRYLDPSGLPFVGRAALQDTMQDLFTNASGAFLAACLIYGLLRLAPTWRLGLLPQRRSSRS